MMCRYLFIKLSHLFKKLVKLNVNDATLKNKVKVKVIKVNIHYSVQTTFVKSYKFNTRWRYVTSATIDEMKEKIISNLTFFYFR